MLVFIQFRAKSAKWGTSILVKVGILMLTGTLLSSLLAPINVRVTLISIVPKAVLGVASGNSQLAQYEGSALNHNRDLD